MPFTRMSISMQRRFLTILLGDDFMSAAMPILSTYGMPLIKKGMKYLYNTARK
jgi:hypothetical protein